MVPDVIWNVAVKNSFSRRVYQVKKYVFSLFFCGANETVAGQIQKNRSNPRCNARVCSKTGERGKLRSEVSGNSMRRSGKSMRKVKISINSNGLGETVT